MFTIYCDGACEPINPGGYACWAWIASTGENDYGCIGYGYGMTNNIAEYEAVIRALRWAKENKLRGGWIKTDSKLVVEQSSGNWQVRAEHLKPKVAEVKQLLIDTTSIIKWIPREENEKADCLTKRTLLEAQQDAHQDIGTTPEQCHRMTNQGKQASWRDWHISDKQAEWLVFFNYEFDKDTITRGQASDILDQLFRFHNKR